MTNKEKLNCWEFKACGREKGGSKADELGICPAYPSSGRKCARVAITLCDGIMHNGFAMKLKDCIHCEFYLSEHYDRDYQDQDSEKSAKSPRQ